MNTEHRVRFYVFFYSLSDGAEALIGFDIKLGQPLRLSAVRYIIN